MGKVTHGIAPTANNVEEGKVSLTEKSQLDEIRLRLLPTKHTLRLEKEKAQKIRFSECRNMD